MGLSLSGALPPPIDMRSRASTLLPMKLHVLSDLHLEFNPRHPPWHPPATGADVVVLAGDIHNGTDGIDWAEQTFAGTPVIYVPGNHEFYGTRHGPALARLKARAAQSANVRVLDEEECVLDGVRFLGATLWTDFALFGESLVEPAMAESLKHVVDYRAIQWGEGTPLRPAHTLALHRQALRFLEARLEQPSDGPTVVVTHHAPHRESVHPRWASHLSSAAFVSRLDHLLHVPALWIHGHTHDGFDYRAGKTRVVANPMGYRRSNWGVAKDGLESPRVSFENPAFDPGRLVEV